MGKVITFYSFKGGVGRTMALANVGLLAAMNGKRVLLMDWDLEAPGLGYYFRGLLNRRDEISLRESPGILNILINWSERVTPSLSHDELSPIKQEYRDGIPFRECVRELVEPELGKRIFPETSCLHFIGAGSRKLTGKDVSYEQALAEFSWANFFSESVGGYLLECLRNWSKANYDLILIDSRTGLADAAGICTMQLPDEVAMCFALNHQNIEGVARVAASINSLSSENIRIRIVPMRVARRDSSESSDAQARAIEALTHVSKLNSDEVKSDLQNLAIAFEDSVPFYETLAPFVASDPELDPLSLAYLRLTKSLLGESVGVVPLSAEVLKRVRERLSPRNATTQYVNELQSAEPARAFSELQRLIEIAQDTALESNVLEPEYVLALFDATLDLLNKIEEVEEAFGLLKGTRELGRILVDRHNDEWKEIYTTILQRSLWEISLYGRDVEELEVRRELEGWLISATEVENSVRRLANLTELARLSLRLSDAIEVTACLNSIKSILDVLLPITNLTFDQKRSLFFSLINTSLVSSEASVLNGDIDDARKILEKGLNDLTVMSNQLGDEVSEEYDSLSFKLHYRLATLPSTPPELSGIHCVEAAECNTQEFAFRYMELAKIALNLRDYPELALSFCNKAFNQHRRRRLIAYFVRSATRGIEFLQSLRDFLKNFGNHLPEHPSALRLLAQTFADAILAVSKQKHVSAGNAARIVRIAEEFVARLHRFEFEDESILTGLEETLAGLKDKDRAE